MTRVLAKSSSIDIPHASTDLFTNEPELLICTTQVPQLPIPQHNPKPGTPKYAETSVIKLGYSFL